jgi:WD40 repeat protein
MGVLPLESVIGFDGKVNGGLVLHPDGRTLIYPLGATVVVKELGDTFAQTFLQGHTDEVSCLTVSPDGRYLASGQLSFMGFSADIIVWDMESRKAVHRMSLHKVKVQDLAFSPCGTYLASLGGQDDNSLVIWDVHSGNAICGTPVPGLTKCLSYFNVDSYKLATGGGQSLVVWDFDKPNRKLRPHKVNMGSLRRNAEYITVDDNVSAPQPLQSPRPEFFQFWVPAQLEPTFSAKFSVLTLATIPADPRLLPLPQTSNHQDQQMFVGTSSGDVLKIALGACVYRQSGPYKSLVPKGVATNAISPTGDIVVGGGDGSVSVLDRESMKIIAVTKLASGVTSCVVAPGVHKDGGFGLYCGTDSCNIYYLKYSPTQGFLSELVQTCHSQAVNDVAFPKGYSEVFATAGSSDVRVWHVSEARELLRVSCPNVECKCVSFMPDGGSILSGWSDGKIRVFAPQTGRLMYTIHDAHKEVSAIVGSSCGGKIVSGGIEGFVRVWRIGPQSQTILASMKEHKGPVNSLALRANDSECVSACSDGSAIIWDLATFHRRAELTANTFFKACAYHPDESQIVTTGTDRKVSWWEAFDGSAIRVVDGSETAEINSLDVSSDGTQVVTGGGDKDIKVWGYDEGACFHVGKGHSGAVTKVKFTPDGQKIVTVGSEGAIFIWQNMPLE